MCIRDRLYWVLNVMAGIAKTTTTPTHMTTLYTVGLTKRFHSPHRKSPGKRPNTTADQPHEQCSHPGMTLSQTGQMKAIVGFPSQTEKLQFRTTVRSVSSEIPVWPIIPATSSLPNSETWQEQRGHPAHMTSPQIRLAPTKQWPIDVC